MAEPRPGLKPGDYIDRKYEVKRRLGRGATGTVYKAWDIAPGRDVAVKILNASLTTGGHRILFDRELRVLAKLKHPGIATLHTHGFDGDSPYIVMEYVHGTTLAVVIDALAKPDEPGLRVESVLPRWAERGDSPPGSADKPLDAAALETMTDVEGHIKVCCRIIRDAARALHVAHEKNVIHRDIKPSNLMLDGAMGLHVVDFGHARLFDEVTITRSGELVGTPAYVSPEQLTGRIKLDRRTDVYSLGIVLYELLALGHPLPASTYQKLFLHIAVRPLTPLSRRNGAVVKELEAVVHKATAKDPDQRYATMEDFANDLNRWLEGGRVAAPLYRPGDPDAAEIASGRPVSILVAGALILGAGVNLMIGALVLYTGMLLAYAIGVMHLRRDPLRDISELSLITISLVIIGIFLSIFAKHLMNGRKWSRMLLGILLFLFYLGYTLGVITGLARLYILNGIDPAEERLRQVAAIGLEIVIATIAFAFRWWLYRPGVNDWLRSAELIRAASRRPEGLAGDLEL